MSRNTIAAIYIIVAIAYAITSMTVETEESKHFYLILVNMYAIASVFTRGFKK